MNEAGSGITSAPERETCSGVVEAEVAHYISPAFKSLQEGPTVPHSVESQIVKIGRHVNRRLRDVQLTDAGRERILTGLFQEASATLCVRGCLLLAERATFPQEDEAHRWPQERETTPHDPIVLAAATKFLISLTPRFSEFDNDDISATTVFMGQLLTATSLPLQETQALCELLASNGWQVIDSPNGWQVIDSPLLRFLVLSNEHCPPHLLEEATWDPDSRWRDIAVLNPNCPEHVRVAVALLGKQGR